jgi:alpha-tubulin suppressor-like RCC1 family protein
MPRTVHVRRFTHPLAFILAGGLVAALGCSEEARSPTEPETGPALTSSSTHTLAFYQVSGGSEHTCGVTTDNRAYCWGLNNYGQLGDGTNTRRLKPVPVAGAFRFRQVSAGDSYTCGVTTDYRAYCWGANEGRGTLGDGTETNRLTPVPVAGGRRFRLVDAGAFHACGVSYPDNKAYCWGYGAEGALGDGAWTPPRLRLTPVAVVGGLRFRQVSAGGGHDDHFEGRDPFGGHSCGVTTTDEAFCWGPNTVGQLGIGGTMGSGVASPTRVAGAHRFRQIEAGSTHTCAVTTNNRAFCWGNGRQGQIGDGKTYLRFSPRAVAGGLSFERVSTGRFHTCGETTSNRAYCWGWNLDGELGDGTTTRRLTPVAVAGGHFFTQVSAGESHTCGKTADAVAYCWGGGVYGQLGDGSATSKSTPVPVAGG